MAKAKMDTVKIQTLQQENEILRQKLAAQEQIQSEMTNAVTDSLSREMKTIRQKGKKSANSITVQEEHDHMNISLWTKYGKRIGPMHPNNAIQTLNRFAEVKGVILTATQPTSEQIDAYKQTAEYKKMIKTEQAIRAVKDKSRRSGEMERLTKAIAKMAGVQDPSTLNTLAEASK